MGSGDVTFEEDPDRFVAVLKDAVAALRDAHIDHLVFGSIASKVYGAAEDVEDVDVLIRSVDADRALSVLAEAAFDVERTEPRWLYKAIRDGVLVDLIFQAAEKVDLDDEMLAHGRDIEFAGVPLLAVAPEDAVVLAALATKAEIPEHWWIALSMLAKAEDVNWAYLVRRARLGPRKVLSLLVFADSEDRGVPGTTVAELFAVAYPGLLAGVSGSGSGPVRPGPDRPVDS